MIESDGQDQKSAQKVQFPYAWIFAGRVINEKVFDLVPDRSRQNGGFDFRRFYVRFVIFVAHVYYFKLFYRKNQYMTENPFLLISGGCQEGGKEGEKDIKSGLHFVMRACIMYVVVDF